MITEERIGWKEKLAGWCKEAETSASAAMIEEQAARGGFRGERARLVTGENLTLLTTIVKLNNSMPQIKMTENKKYVECWDNLDFQLAKSEATR